MTTGNLPQLEMARQIALDQSTANTKQARAEEEEKYQQWLSAGQAKGMKLVFRAVRSHETVVTRPHASLQAGAKILARLRQWVPVWQGSSTPATISQELVADAVAQARTLPALSYFCAASRSRLLA